MLKSVLSRLAILAALAASLWGCDGDKPPAKPPADNPLAKRMIAGVVGAEGRAYPLPYQLFVPDGYDKERAYPLVLFLHGANGLGNDNQTQLDENVTRLVSPEVQGIEPAFVLAPQCPNGDQWVNADQEAPFTNYDQSKVGESDASKMVFELLSGLSKRYNIDSRRLYITGPSMGGSGTWDFITRHPGVFAAAVPVTGVCDPSRAKLIKDLPIWAFHGEKDPVAPVDNTRAMVKALKALGSDTVHFNELKGVGHNSWGPAYTDMEMLRWLFQQKRP